MQKDILPKAPGVTSTRRNYLIVAGLGVAFIVLIVGFLQKSGHLSLSRPDPVSPTSVPAQIATSIPAAAKPQYFKKALVYKRTLADSEQSSVRASAMTAGYKALAAIPPAVMEPQASIRVPSFPDSSAMSNYQALSTLGTQQYYSNINVQQYLNSFSSQRYVQDLTNRQFINNLNTQTYLSNMRTWQNTTVFNAQQYLNTLNTRQYWNNFNNQQYLNNWNTFSSPTFTQPRYTQPIYIPPMPSFPSFNFP